MSAPCAAHVLVMAPFLHRPGHTATFPFDLAAGFAANGAGVTLVCPFAPQVTSEHSIKPRVIDQELDHTPTWVQFAWRHLRHRPILLCLLWLIHYTRSQTPDLVYWTDMEPGNQRALWPLSLARLLGLVRHRLAFSEHHRFAWESHRLARLLRLDRLRLRGIEMFVHSRDLLHWTRQVMAWPAAGRYLPWGVWPDPASADDRAAARAALDLAEHARVLLVFGIQSFYRKEIDTLAAALSDLPLTKPLVVLFVGRRACTQPHPFDDPRLVSKPNLSVRRIEDFVAADQVKTYFAAADGVWAFYGVFIGASGVLLQSLGYGRLPIASDAGEIGGLCREHGSGLLAPVKDMEGLRATLQHFVNMADAEQQAHEAAARIAAEQLSWREIAGTILNVSSRSPAQRPTPGQASPSAIGPSFHTNR